MRDELWELMSVGHEAIGATCGALLKESVDLVSILSSIPQSLRFHWSGQTFWSYQTDNSILVAGHSPRPPLPPHTIGFAQAFASPSTVGLEHAFGRREGATAWLRKNRVLRLHFMVPRQRYEVVMGIPGRTDIEFPRPCAI